MRLGWGGGASLLRLLGPLGFGLGLLGLGLLARLRESRYAPLPLLDRGDDASKDKRLCLVVGEDTA